MIMPYIVYVHKNKTNGKVYVGITSQNPSRRWRNGNGYKDNRHFYNAIQKYGWDSFDHIIVADSLKKEDACQMERELIKQYNSCDERYGYNLSTGGETPAVGHKHTDEYKQYMHDIMLGRIISDDSRRKIGDKARARLAVHNPAKGRTGVNCHQAKKVKQYDMNGNFIQTFYGTHEACRAIKRTSPSKIGEACRNIRKSAYGFKWEYARGEE